MSSPCETHVQRQLGSDWSTVGEETDTESTAVSVIDEALRENESGATNSEASDGVTDGQTDDGTLD